jgi:hypothetical protein
MQVMGVGDRWRTVQMVEDGSGGYPGRTPSYRQRLPTQQLECFPPAGGYPPASVGGGAPPPPTTPLPGPSSNTAVPFAIPPFVGTMTPEIYAFMRQNQQLFTTPSKPPNSQ